MKGRVHTANEILRNLCDEYLQVEEDVLCETIDGNLQGDGSCGGDEQILKRKWLLLMSGDKI